MKLPLVLRALVGALIVGLAGCAARTADGIRTWQLRGAIKSVHDTTIQVRHKSGQIVRLTVDGGTTYVSRDGPASLQSLTPGRRVSVLVESLDGTARARRVQVSGGRR